MKVTELMEAAEQLYYDEITKIENEIRTKLLIPFCDKHKIAFDSGMGAWNLKNEFIDIYGARPDYWEVPRKTLVDTKTDEEADALVEKAQAFRTLLETFELTNALDERTMRGAPVGCNIEPYTPGALMTDTPGVPKTCACKGTGLIPPTSDLKKGEHQVYCPTHKSKRDWPQLQADGSTEYKELRPGNQGLK